MNRSLKKLSDDELMSEWTSAAKELEKLKKKISDFSAEHQRRQLEAQARAKLHAMSDEERLALAQIAKTEGIESEQKMGAV